VIKKLTPLKILTFIGMNSVVGYPSISYQTTR